MSHFYGTMKGSSRGEATRCATKASGLTVTAASWNGAIRVELRHDHETGHDKYVVTQVAWHGKGAPRLLAEGVVGEPAPTPAQIGAALANALAKVTT